MPPRAVEKKTTSDGEKPAKTIAKSKRTAKVLQPIGTYGQGSVEKAKQLPMLPEMAKRKANTCYRMMYTIDGKDTEVVVRTRNGGKNGVLKSRACTRCGNKSREQMATPGDVFCPRNECGGKKDESANRAQNARYKAKRDVNEPALQALMDDHKVPRAPNNANDAEDGKTYAMLNRANGQKPQLVRRKRNGKVFQYVAWCACKGEGGGKTRANHCNICVGKRSEGKRKDLKVFCSECKRTQVCRGNTICAGCRGAPTERKLALIHKAHVLSDYLIRGLHKRGREDLVANINEDCIKTNDATGVCSGRREDIDLNATPMFNINTEWSENQHKGSNYTAECARRKYTGQLADRGAPAFTEAEGNVLDCRPTNKEMDDLERAGKLTDEHVALRRRRHIIVKNMLKDKSEREEAVEAGSVAVPMKMRVMNFNPDAFTDSNGIMQPSLFREVPKDEFDGTMRFKPRVKRLEAALDPFISEMVRLADRAKDEAWYEARPHLAVSFWRYDGCNASGRPVKRPRTLFKA